MLAKNVRYVVVKQISKSEQCLYFVENYVWMIIIMCMYKHEVGIKCYRILKSEKTHVTLTYLAANTLQ